jgi:glycine hydroxymethyltransferase
MVPFDDKSPFITSGIRIGTPAITSRGMQEADMEKIVAWIDDTLMNADNEAHLIALKKQINDFANPFSIPQ